MSAISFFSTKDVEWNDLSVYISGVQCAKVTDFEAGIKSGERIFACRRPQPAFNTKRQKGVSF